MVEKFNKNNINSLINLLFFLKENKNKDLYVTEDNCRYFIEDYPSLKKLLKNSSNIFISKEEEKVNGIILTWNSIGNNIKRQFIKIKAENEKIANKLVTVLFWNLKTKELYLKIKNSSPFLSLFKSKNFKFKGGRGEEILLIKELGEEVNV